MFEGCAFIFHEDFMKMVGKIEKYKKAVTNQGGRVIEWLEEVPVTTLGQLFDVYICYNLYGSIPSIHQEMIQNREVSVGSHAFNVVKPAIITEAIMHKKFSGVGTNELKRYIVYPESDESE